MSQGFTSGQFTDNTKIPLTEKGVPNGVATLDATGHVPASQLPPTTDSTKAGIVTAITFAGNPKMATVTFASPFPDNNYAIVITGVDNRNWTAESITANGFIINANANKILLGQVYWSATHSGS